MAEQFVPQLTAGIDPKRFSDHLVFARDPRVAAAILALFIVMGFGLRMNQLGAESLGEDEFNKLQTVEEYRTNGLSGRNGEHPFLMKGLQTLSISAAERLNSFGAQISDEGALRFPVALFGTFTALLIFLLVSELFGRSIGLIAGILWAIEPIAIGFDRIAKEDSLALFFFLLTNLFWLKSQSKAERGEPHWLRYVWLAGAAFGALMASKYYPHLLGITAAYYALFQVLPGNKWALGRPRWLKLMIIIGITFLVLNPTILFPDTWREMLKFSSEGRIGHDSYEYMGQLYNHKMTGWLYGVPWTFYYVFIAVKTSLSTLILFLIGLPLMFRRKLADGRFFIAIWAFMWFVPYSVLGGKFTRYFTMAEPIILTIAAVGLFFGIKWLTSQIANARLATCLQVAVLLIVAIVPIANSIASVPHYRLFTNSIGTYFGAPGWYFPHDEIYDGSSREIALNIVRDARQGATIASETPSLLEHYVGKAGRTDMKFVLLSDRTAAVALQAGDVVVETKGRRYFSNAAMLDALRSTSGEKIKMGNAVAAEIYRLDAESAQTVRQIASQ